MLLTFVEKNICLVKTDRNFRIFCFPNATAYREFLAKKLQQKDGSTRGNDSKLSNYDTERDAVFTCSQPDLTGTIDSVLTKVFRRPTICRQVVQFPSSPHSSPGPSVTQVTTNATYLAQECALLLNSIIPSSSCRAYKHEHRAPRREEFVPGRPLLIRTGKWRAYFEPVPIRQGF